MDYYQIYLLILLIKMYYKYIQYDKILDKIDNIKIINDKFENNKIDNLFNNCIIELINGILYFNFIQL